MVTKSLYHPGRIYPIGKPQPFVEEDLLFMRRLPSGEGDIPLGRRRIKRIPGRTLRRFTTGRTFREWGKTRIMGKLNLLPSRHIPDGVVVHDSIINAPQLPQAFPELAGFDDIAEGKMSPTRTNTTRRNIWGSLENLITQTGEWFTSVKRAEYEGRIAAARAEIARQQARREIIVKERDVIRNLPIFIIGAGIGLGIIYLIKSKKR
ncbi:MAG: hypothetical protein DDT18_01829 [Actinobacteria bacterium]|nr:hypothetical protein [Actinomycetota bacterium]